MNRNPRMLLSAACMTFTLAALAGETKAPEPIHVHDKLTIKATVEAVDQAQRTLTVKGPKGNLTTFAVDEAVTRFDQLKVGDVITAHYYESVLIEVRKPDAAPMAETVAGTVVPTEGAKPGGVGVIQETITVEIMAIDRNTPAVTVRTLDGEELDYRVRDKKNLKNVSVGDRVVVTRTQGLVIDISSAS